MTIFINHIVNIIPDPTFIVVAAGFLGVIMAFLIPLSVEIISKVSAKYNSDVIVRLYKDSFIRRIFTNLLLFSIAAMIITRFLISNAFLESPIGKIIMWAILILSILITVLIGYLIKRIDRFISDDAMPLDILSNEVVTALGIRSKHYHRLDEKSKQTIPSQAINKEKFILAIEGIGDILVYQVGRQNNSLIIKGLEHISQSIDTIYALRQHYPSRFDALVYDKEVLTIMTNNESDKHTIYEICLNDPNRHLAGIATPLNQLKRIYKAALEKQNSEVARISLHKMNSLTSYLATQPDNAFLVEISLKNMIECTQLAIRIGDKSADIGIPWYINTLHQQPHQGKGAFQLEYLDIYNRYFIEFVSHIIAESHRSAFYYLVRHLIRIYSIPNEQRGKIWGYHYLLRASNLEKYRRLNEETGIQRQVRHLAMTEAYLDTMEQLESWLERFEKLRQTIHPHLVATKKSEARRLDKIIQNNAIQHFKQRRLLRAAYALGTYCLLHGEYRSLRYFWDQADNDKILPGSSIIPQTAQQVINDYLRRTDVLSKLEVSDTRIESYFKRYYILLLAKIKKQDNYILPIFNAQQLHQVNNSIDDLIKTTKDMKDTNVFGLLDFDKGKVDLLVKQKLLPFLRAIKKDAHKQLLLNYQKRKIGISKCNAYKKQLLLSWQKHASLRDLFINYLRSFENRTHKRLKEQPRGWGIDELVNKSALLENWDPEKGIGFRHGRTIANSENSFLFDSMAELCIGRSQRSFDKVINSIADPENIFIIAPKWAVINFLANQENFTVGHNIATEARKLKKKYRPNQFKSFVGYYDFNEHNIPVFVFEYSGSGHQMLILNRNKVGAMIQLPLYSIEGKKRPTTQSNIFYFKMQDLTTNSQLVNYYIKQQLPWLQQKGDISEQRNYLRELMLVKVLQNLSFKPNSGFVGYRITITAQQPSASIDYETATGLLPV